MADSDDLTYFEQRAETEIKAAQAAQHPDAVKAHYELAGIYLDKVHNSGSGQHRETYQ